MNKTFGIILAVAAFLSAGSAYAGGVYVVGGLSATNLDVGTDNTNFDRAVGANVGIGYDVNDWLAVEGTYDYLGSNDFTYRSVYNNVGNPTADVDGKFDARAFTGWVVADPTVATIGSMPLKVIGRVGYANTKVNYTGGSVTDNKVAYGAGVGLGVTKNVDVVLDYRVYNIDNSSADVDLNTVGLSAKYTF